MERAQLQQHIFGKTHLSLTDQMINLTTSYFGSKLFLFLLMAYLIAFITIKLNHELSENNN